MIGKLIDNLVSNVVSKVKASPKVNDYTFDGSSSNTMGYTSKAPSKPIVSVKPK